MDSHFCVSQEREGQQSLEAIQANQIFPRKSPVLEEDDLQVPFPELHGEFTEYVGRAEDSVIAMSNYRLHIKFKESVVNVPLQLIESVECREMFQLHVTCKDCKVVRCQFSTFEQCQEWLKRLMAAVRPPSRLEDLFAFAYYAWFVDVCSSERDQSSVEPATSLFRNEVERMGFDTQNAWRISEINIKHKLCSSYPQLLLVPAWITDKELENVAAFRSWKRFPAVVYRHQITGAVIARCGQPEVSWWGWRNADDEHLVQSIAKACAVDSSSQKLLTNGSCNGADLSDVDFGKSHLLTVACSTVVYPHKLLILDARSYAAAVANRAKGGGCECPEYYPNCEVVFMGMANIHSIRKSFQSLRFLCTQMPDPANWLSALESTKWLQHLSLLLKAALLVVNAVDRDQRPVLVHCSDGWDRTPQIVALSKLLLDPFYRTMEGFQVLVETEWLEFGHKFADRCGHGENTEDLNERCPVFLQWLDCVHQLQRQFPCSFEFNEAFLVKLVQHSYSCLFGTFLCNSGKEREERRIQERTCSVWSLMRPANRSFRNMLYSAHSEAVLHPVCHVRNLMLWTAVYLPSSSPTTPSDDSCAPYPVPGSSAEEQPLGRRPKTRSFDNLPSACEVLPNRRSSDPSLNEKWQDHRRSLELNIGAGPDGASQEQDSKTNNQLGAGLIEGQLDGEGEELQNVNHCNLGLKSDMGVEEAELAVSMGVAMGQMENILQEATTEDSAVSEGHKATNRVCLNGSRNAKDFVGNGAYAPSELSVNGMAVHHNNDAEKVVSPRPKLNGFHAEVVNGELSPPLSPIAQQASENQETKLGLGLQAVEDLAITNTHWSHMAPSTTRTMSQLSGEGVAGDNDRLPPEADKRLSLLESSTETLTEEGVTRTETLTQQPPSDLVKPHCAAEADPEPSVPWTLSNGGSGSTTQHPSLSALPPVSTEACNGNSLDPELSTPQWGKANGEHAPLSRQLSLASCGSQAQQQQHQLLHRNSCSHHRCLFMHGLLARPPPSPEQPARSHLDEDGLTLHTDTIQQRLRQIEASHQAEVETLKKQVQELWSRLETPPQPCLLIGPILHSECNLDTNCLSRCSTELFSEASWEQVDKQDTEVTRWYPDHLAAQCYGCESRFWLAARKHHCRNCGNVFCASCCDQKIPVPSQQLFEPSRVCKTCYSSLQVSATPTKLDLEKPIAASSN
uniref:phosphatidylinositol-3,5-bisphosphate 3-phosphatase n=1 Tax=Denticeps clupeoides TaxID=299321 RepID=A0AAY4DN94_9TELE